jgi:WD40 repeat protein
MFTALRGSFRVPSFIFHATPNDKTFHGYGQIMSAATMYNINQSAKTPHLVTGDASGRIAIWNLTSGAPVGFTWQTHPVKAMAQLPYNKLATADGRRVRIWKSGKLRSTLETSLETSSETLTQSNTRDVIGLMALPHGRLAVATAYDVRIWDTIRGTPLMTLNSCGALITALPNDALASYCPREKKVRVFNTESGARLNVIHTGRVEAMTSLPNGTLATISERLALWNVHTGVCLASKPVDSIIMHQRMASTSGNYILSNTRTSHFSVFDGKNLKTRELCAVREDPAHHLLSLPDGRILTIDVQSLVQVWGGL